MFWFAGLAARDADGEPTMAILTTDANAVAKPVHARMPVVLSNDAADTWLNGDTAESTLRDLLVPMADELIEAYPIGRADNKPQYDGPELVNPLEA